MQNNLDTRILPNLLSDATQTKIHLRIEFNSGIEPTVVVVVVGGSGFGGFLLLCSSW